MWDLESTFVYDVKSGELVPYLPEAYRKNRDGLCGYVENVIDSLLERARQSSEGRDELRRYIQNHPKGGDIAKNTRKELEQKIGKVYKTKTKRFK